MLFKSVTGVDVHPTTIWEWVQAAGHDAMQRLEQELARLEEACPSADVVHDVIAQLPLLCGGDGVMVPFRPQARSAHGKNVWREVKVGIVARLGQRVTRTGRTVSVLVRRRLVAVLGTIDDVQPRLWLTAMKEDITTAIWWCGYVMVALDFGEYMRSGLPSMPAASSIFIMPPSIFGRRQRPGSMAERHRRVTGLPQPVTSSDMEPHTRCFRS